MLFDTFKEKIQKSNEDHLKKMQEKQERNKSIRKAYKEAPKLDFLKTKMVDIEER